jgi:RNA polymerase sigma-70 factor (ECF subfamily)
MTDKKIKALIQSVALQDSQSAFKTLFYHFYPSLFSFSNAFVKCRESAEEIVEDAFIRLWDRRATLPQIANLKVYLWVTVKNLSINYLERSGKPYAADLNQLDVSCAALVPTPEDLMVAAEMAHAINKVISELPPRCRIVYKLVREDGLKHKEVASILQISPRTVEHQIALALRRIAAAIRMDFKVSDTARFNNS